MKFFEKKVKEDERNYDNFPPIGGLMVSKMIVDENIKPGFMYREKRMQAEDSGWRIFTGLESEEYINNPDNSGFYNPSTILKVDSSIEKILLTGIGSVYEKSNGSPEWSKVTDFKLDDDYMVTHQLRNEWTIKINNLFERRVEENGDLLYTTGDKSVRLVIWNEIGKSKAIIHQERILEIESRDQTLSRTLNTFDFSDEKVLRVGYLIQEDNGDKRFGVLYGFSIIDNQVMQAALYFDEDEDLNWAIDTWQNIQMKKITQD